MRISDWSSDVCSSDLLELSTEWIMVHGELQIGTEARPFTHKATITLTNNVKDEQLMGMGDRGIMLSGGTLNLHGNRDNTRSEERRVGKECVSTFRSRV